MIFGSKKKVPEAGPPPEAASTDAASQTPAAQAAQQVASAMSGDAGAAQADGTPEIDPEMAEKIAAIRVKLHETFGKVALAMMTVPRYRNMSLSDLGHLVLDPLMRDRVALAAPAKDGEAEAGALSGLAIWASVSEEVDGKIREQIKAGTFPIRLKPEDWTSGNINWLLDVIAPNQRMTTSVIANFRQVVKEGDMRIHPIVTRLVDPEALKKMGAQPINEAGGNAAGSPADGAPLN